jgi:hypothetical protein
MDGLPIWIEAHPGEILRLRGGHFGGSALCCLNTEFQTETGGPEEAEVHSQIVRRMCSDYGRIGTECLSPSEVTTDRAAENRIFAGITYGARRI